MEIILKVIGFIQNLGSSVMMAVVVTLLGILFGTKPGKALRAGLTVGVGLVGITTIFGLLGANLGPATQAMVERYGFSLSVIDVGWPAASAIAMATNVGAMIIPLGLVVNIVMLLTNTTQTVNVDIWNYWHFAFTGALVAGVTGNIGYGFIAAAVNMVIVLIIGDLTAPAVAKYNGLEGISIPHGFSGAFVPLAWLTDWVIDHIPGLKDVDFNFEQVQKKFGVVGEPIFIGTVIGTVIGFLAGYGTKALGLGVTMGAVLVLTPKMAALLMEGRGELVSCDIHPHKIQLLAAGRDRLGLDLISPTLQNAARRREEWTDGFDVVLTDVPCSGLGIVRKKPDIRYKDPEPLKGLPRVQRSILDNCAGYVRPGGVLAYSTCTLLERENGGVVDGFLADHLDFVPEPFVLPHLGEQPGRVTFWPHIHGTDGFFVAKLRRKG